MIVKGRLTGPGVHNHLYELYGDKKVMPFTGVPLETKRGRKLDGRADALALAWYGATKTD